MSVTGLHCTVVNNRSVTVDRSALYSWQVCTLQLAGLHCSLEFLNIEQVAVSVYRKRLVVPVETTNLKGFIPTCQVKAVTTFHMFCYAVSFVVDLM